MTAGLVTALARIAGEFSFGGQEHFYLETPAAWAEAGEDGTVSVNSSIQHPSEIQTVARFVATDLGPGAVPLGQRLRSTGGAFYGACGEDDYDVAHGVSRFWRAPGYVRDRRDCGSRERACGLPPEVVRERNLEREKYPRAARDYCAGSSCTPSRWTLPSAFVASTSTAAGWPAVKR